MNSSKSTEIPKLPLTSEERRNGLVEVISMRRTYVGQTLAELMESEDSINDPAEFADRILGDPSMLTLHEGHLHFLEGLGIPVSADQLIEWDAIAYAYKNTNFGDRVKLRTFSFGSYGYKTIKQFFDRAESMHVYVTPTLVKALREEWESHTTNGLYKVEFVTTSNVTMIYQVMEEAGLSGKCVESMRECPAAENSMESDPQAAKRTINAEELKFKQAVSDALAANILSAMSSGDETSNDISTDGEVL